MRKEKINKKNALPCVQNRHLQLTQRAQHDIINVTVIHGKTASGTFARHNERKLLPMQKPR